MAKLEIMIRFQGSNAVNVYYFFFFSPRLSHLGFSIDMMSEHQICTNRIEMVNVCAMEKVGRHCCRIDHFTNKYIHTKYCVVESSTAWCYFDLLYCVEYFLCDIKRKSKGQCRRGCRHCSIILAAVRPTTAADSDGFKVQNRTDFMQKWNICNALLWKSSISLCRTVAATSWRSCSFHLCRTHSGTTKINNISVIHAAMPTPHHKIFSKSLFHSPPD